MKLQLKIFIIGSLFAYVCATSCTDDDWLKYKEKYNKKYKTAEDELSHHSTFCDNIKAIDEHNKLYDRGESTYTMGVNQFADLTKEQLSQMFAGYGNKHAKGKVPGLRSSLLS